MICCIIILITYIVIFGLLTYYFIKKRTLWNELFSINNIINTLVEIFACPEHFIIYIPGILYENTYCVHTKIKKNENKEKIRIVLTKISSIFKKFSTLGLESHEQDTAFQTSRTKTKDLENPECKIQDQDNSSISNNINQVKWLLNGTLDNFNHMYEETAEFYNNLSGSYKILNENTNTSNNSSNTQNAQNLITLEKLVLLEQNIEYCDSILKLLEIIDYKHYKDYVNSEDNINYINNTNTCELNNVFQINNNYMICLIYNLIESIRLYKIKLYKIINI